MVTNGLGVLTDHERSPEASPTDRAVLNEEFIANGLVRLAPLLGLDEHTPEAVEPAASSETNVGLKESTKMFLSRFVEGDLNRLTIDDLDIVVPAVVRANTPDNPRRGRPPREDLNDIIDSAIRGMYVAQIAELYGSTVVAIRQILYAISSNIIKLQGGRLTIEDLIGRTASDALRDTPYSVPEDWFVDPIRIIPAPGARNLGQGEIDEENPLAWQADALCAQTDPEAFFPEKGGSTRDAKKVCKSCEVKLECLQYALDNDERFGIWGGLSEQERRRLRKRK